MRYSSPTVMSTVLLILQRGIQFAAEADRTSWFDPCRSCLQSNAERDMNSRVNMETPRAVLVVFCCLCTATVSTEGAEPDAFTCTAGNFTAGEKASVTCFFHKDVSKIWHHVYVTWFPFHTTMKYKDVATCFRTRAILLKCVIAEGYTYNNVISDILTVEIPHVTTALAGRYTCSLVPDDGKVTYNCDLYVEKPTTPIQEDRVEKNTVKGRAVTLYNAWAEDLPDDVKKYLKDQGYDNMYTLKKLSHEQIQSCPLKPGHKVALERKLQILFPLIEENTISPERVSEEQEGRTGEHPPAANTPGTKERDDRDESNAQMQERAKEGPRCVKNTYGHAEIEEDESEV